MADFRRKEYRGSLLLVQECGPVDIVVDTDAKTVTPSLAKADSAYSIAGGGGGLELLKTTLHLENRSDNAVDFADLCFFTGLSMIYQKSIIPLIGPPSIQIAAGETLTVELYYSRESLEDSIVVDVAPNPEHASLTVESGYVNMTELEREGVKYYQVTDTAKDSEIKLILSE